MPEFVVERNMPRSDPRRGDELMLAVQSSRSVLRELGPAIQWVHSYVTDDKIYCIYRAPNAELIREHAGEAVFPANSIARIRAVISPVTAE